MGVARKNTVIPYGLAGLLAFGALEIWLVALDSAALAIVSCNNTFSILAEAAQCRWPAIYVSICWVLFTAAIASGWVGGVRSYKNRAAHGALAARGLGTPHDAHPST